jgi:hypothetical protein
MKQKKPAVRGSRKKPGRRVSEKDTGLHAYPPGLVRTWLEVVLDEQQCTKAEALRILNRETGAGVGSNRLYEWLTQRHEPPREVRVYMLQQALRPRLSRLCGRELRLDVARSLAVDLS